MNYSIYISYILLFLFHTDVICQDNITYSEDEIKTQSSFISAKLLLYKGDTTKSINKYEQLLKTDQTDIAAYELSKIYSKKEAHFEAAKYGKMAFEGLKNKEHFLQHMLYVYMKSDDQKSYLTTIQILANDYPNNKGYFFQLIDQLNDQQDHKEALKLLNKRETAVGVREEIIKRKFDIYIQLKKHKKAEKELLKIIDKYPTEILYLYNLASFYSQTKQQSKVKAIYHKILILNPDDKNAQFVLEQNDPNNSNQFGMLQGLLPVVENPTSNIDDVINRLIPSIEELNNNYNNKLSELLVLLTEKLVVSHADNAKAYSVCADVLYLSGQLEKSKKHYIKALALDKSVFSIWNQLFLILDRLKDHQTLYSYTEKALDFYPNQASVYIYHSLSSSHLNKIAQSIENLEEAELMLSQSDNFAKQQFQLAKATHYILSNNRESALLIIADFEKNKDKLSFEILEKLSQLFGLLENKLKEKTYENLSIQSGNQYLKLNHNE